MQNHLYNMLKLLMFLLTPFLSYQSTSVEITLARLKKEPGLWNPAGLQQLYSSPVETVRDKGNSSRLTGCLKNSNLIRRLLTGECRDARHNFKSFSFSLHIPLSQSGHVLQAERGRSRRLPGRPRWNLETEKTFVCINGACFFSFLRFYQIKQH